MNLAPGIVLPLVAALALYLLGKRRTPERRLSAGAVHYPAYVVAALALMAGWLRDSIHRSPDGRERTVRKPLSRG